MLEMGIERSSRGGPNMRISPARMGAKPIPRECSACQRRLARGRMRSPLEIIDKFAVIFQVGHLARHSGKQEKRQKSYVIDITLEFVILFPDGAFVITNVPDNKSNVPDNSRCSLRGPAANPGPWRDAPCETAAAHLMYIPIGYTLR
jgi:hypothetical protein